MGRDPSRQSQPPCSARKAPLARSNQRLVDRRPREVAVVDVLGQRQLGNGQLIF